MSMYNPGDIFCEDFTNGDQIYKIYWRVKRNSDHVELEFLHADPRTEHSFRPGDTHRTSDVALSNGHWRKVA